MRRYTLAFNSFCSAFVYRVRRKCPPLLSFFHTKKKKTRKAKKKKRHSDANSYRMVHMQHLKQRIMLFFFFPHIPSKTRLSSTGFLFSSIFFFLLLSAALATFLTPSFQVGDVRLYRLLFFFFFFPFSLHGERCNGNNCHPRTGMSGSSEHDGRRR